jgi:hypothetical protein
MASGFSPTILCWSDTAGLLAGRCQASRLTETYFRSIIYVSISIICIPTSFLCPWVIWYNLRWSWAKPLEVWEAKHGVQNTELVQKPREAEQRLLILSVSALRNIFMGFYFKTPSFWSSFPCLLGIFFSPGHPPPAFTPYFDPLALFLPQVLRDILRVHQPSTHHTGCDDQWKVGQVLFPQVIFWNMFTE